MTEERKQRSQDEVDALGAKGQAYKNADGHYSYPIETEADLKNAIQAYGRAAAGEQSGLKAFIIKRANALGASEVIPDDWKTASRSRKPRNRVLDQLRPEHRSVQDIEVRHGDDDAIVLTGTPIVYDTPYKVNGASGSFSETVQRGAASHLLNSDVVLAWNHDTDAIPLARTSSGTLKLTDAADGLHFEARLDPRNPSAVALESAVSRRDVSQMSIGFSVAQDKWAGVGQQRSRSIRRFGSLIDISPVVWPASPTTSVSVMQRAMLTAPNETLADLDRIYVELRNAEQRGGRVLSSDNEDALKTALQSVHDVLAANGFDAQSFLGSSADNNEDVDVDEEADEAEAAGEDRSTPPSSSDDEPAEEPALSAAPMLELELELKKKKTRAAHAQH